MQNFELMNMVGPTGPSAAAAANAEVVADLELDMMDGPSAAAAANAEVAEIMSIPNFEQLESPFFEEEVVDALREVTRHVNSNSTYEQIQGYLDEFDRQYGIIFRDDSKGRGLVFPQYIEHGGVRLGLEALKQAIAVINARVVTSSRFHSDWEGATTTPRTRTPLSSKIIDKYNKYKPAYDKQMSDDARFGVDGRGSRRGGNTRKKNIKRQKRYSQRRLRLRRKNKNKTHKRRRSRRMF